MGLAGPWVGVRGTGPSTGRGWAGLGLPSSQDSRSWSTRVLGPSKQVAPGQWGAQPALLLPPEAHGLLCWPHRYQKTLEQPGPSERAQGDASIPDMELKEEWQDEEFPQ